MGPACDRRPVNGGRRRLGVRRAMPWLVRAGERQSQGAVCDRVGAVGPGELIGMAGRYQIEGGDGIGSGFCTP